MNNANYGLETTRKAGYSGVITLCHGKLVSDGI